MRRLIGCAATVAWAATAYWHTHKTLPPGARVASGWYALAPGAVAYLTDSTSADAYGHPLIRQTIFEQLLRAVASASDFIVIDSQLFSDAGEVAPASMPVQHNSSRELTAALLARRQAVPGLRVLIITDPANAALGPAEDLEKLRAAGVAVVSADLDQLRDPNFLYSSLWRLTVRWWTDDSGFGAAARRLNLKADHRKVLLADDGRGGLIGIVSSANIHAPDSADSNSALLLRGEVVAPLLESELALARAFGWDGLMGVPTVRPGAQTAEAANAAVRARVLTEGALRDALIERLLASGSGSAIDISARYLADRTVIEALLAAARRGAAVRLILDPQRVAAGESETGIPNRQAAAELMAASEGAIRVRWYRTHGEQFNGNAVMIYDAARLWLASGSADLTRRSLGDYNLEANAVVETPRTAELAQQALAHFDELWGNRAPSGVEYTADPGVYADASQLRYWCYRLMEASGLSAF